MFQYHPGAIKRITGAATVPQPTMFQYHPGAIKRQNIVTEKTLHHQFQYHPGAIKSKGARHYPRATASKFVIFHNFP